MKTIEERAREYAAITWQNDPEKQSPANLGYRAGAISERAELTRWNDPKEVFPGRQRDVVIKYKYRRSRVYYAIGCYDGKWVTDWGVIAVGTVIGWRPIHE